MKILPIGKKNYKYSLFKLKVYYITDKNSGLYNYNMAEIWKIEYDFNPRKRGENKEKKREGFNECFNCQTVMAFWHILANIHPKKPTKLTRINHSVASTLPSFYSREWDCIPVRFLIIKKKKVKSGGLVG